MSDTPIADMVETMLADGVSAAAIVLAVRTVETAVALSANVRGHEADNSDKRRASDRERKRRDRQLRGPDSAWRSLVARVIERDGAVCKYCGSAEKLTADHVVPLTRGGTNDLANLVACCRDCNLKKGNKLISEWSRGKQTMSANSSIQTSGLSTDRAEYRCDVEKDSRREFDQGSKKEVVARARGTRLPPDWKPNESLRQFALEHGIDPDAACAEFVDFWIGVPGQRGVKLNWDSTFRNRVRDLASGKYRPRAGPPQRQQQPSFRDIANQILGSIDETSAIRPDEAFDGPVIDGQLDLGAGGIRTG